MKVSAWNEWGRLRHVILGRVDGTMLQAPEPAVHRDFPEHGFPSGSFGSLPNELAAAADEQLDNFAALLTSQGIRVDRPDPLDFSQPIQTPDWQQASMFGCLPARDLLITVGNEILEATMSFRSRWFEYLAYRPLLESYFAADPGMRWEAAPKPRLTDRSYHPGFWEEYLSLSVDEQLARVRRNDLILTEAEPLFDAADIAKFGKDLFVQLSLVTNRSGVRWLTQHFPNHRVHPVTFDNTLPLHVDATWVPLRPGLVLHNSDRPAESDLEQFCKVNDWEIVQAAQPAHDRASMPPLCIYSPWLSMNILSLDERTICVEERETAQMEQLTQLGFEVIPVPFWHVYPFGGGLNCATMDVHRDGDFEDYFPKRYGRF
jgi:glycine amidinotransferase